MSFITEKVLIGLNTIFFIFMSIYFLNLYSNNKEYIKIPYVIKEYIIKYDNVEYLKTYKYWRNEKRYEIKIKDKNCEDFWILFMDDIETLNYKCDNNTGIVNIYTQIKLFY